MHRSLQRVGVTVIINKERIMGQGNPRKIDKNCYYFNGKCHPQVHLVEHLVPSWGHCSEEIVGPLEGKCGEESSRRRNWVAVRWDLSGIGHHRVRSASAVPDPRRQAASLSHCWPSYRSNRKDDCSWGAPRFIEDTVNQTQTWFTHLGIQLWLFVNWGTRDAAICACLRCFKY